MATGSAALARCTQLGVKRRVFWIALWALMVGTAPPGGGQELDPNLWGTNGNILGISRLENTVYVAGNFTRVGPNTGCFVPVDRTTGDALAAFPRVAGVLKAAVPDRFGGWFLGGGLTGVAGVPCAGLSHILSDGQVVDWTPAPNGWVHAMALKGDTLFVGGTFSEINGLPRRSIAAIDANSGEVLGWAPDADGLVRSLLVIGSRLYVGGDFSRIGGQNRRGIAELDPFTGGATDWNPDVTVAGGAGFVRALASVGDTLFIGGLFNRVGDQNRVNLAAIDLYTAQATSWNPVATSCNCNSYDPSPYVDRLVPGNGTIYVAGHFSIVGGVDRGGLAELDLVSGVPTAWDPQPGPRRTDYAPIITSLALTERTIYVGGGFTEIGGQARYTLAELDRATGRATQWNPNTDAAPSILAIAENRVFVGGSVGLMGCVERRCLAAFDATTGKPTHWDPNPNGFFASAVAATRDRVYVAGDFSHVGGEEHWSLAALDTLTGRALDWTADANGVVGKLEIVGNRLFAGGYFTMIGEAPRGRLASFNLETGDLDSLDLNLDLSLYEICGAGDKLYLGGFFSRVAGQERKYVAVVDITNGTLLDWHPEPDQPVLAIAVKDSTVFLGGAFSTVDGVPRERIAAVGASTGTLRDDWLADTANPNPSSNRVYDLAVVGSSLYVAGSMDSIGGRVRGGLAALDAESGRVLDWDPKLSGANVHEPLQPGIPWSLATDGNTLYVGGLFLWSGAFPASTLAALSTVPEPETPLGPVPLSISMSIPYPNPAVEATTVRFALPTAAMVDLTVYDVRGRRVESLIEDRVQTAGRHEVPIRTSGWASGFYFCRLDVNGESVTRKFVVTR